MTRPVVRCPLEMENRCSGLRGIISISVRHQGHRCDALGTGPSHERQSRIAGITLSMIPNAFRAGLLSFWLSETERHRGVPRINMAIDHGKSRAESLTANGLYAACDLRPIHPDLTSWGKWP